MDIFQGMNLNQVQWVLSAISSILIGFSKTGFSGAGTLAIPIMAAIFGGKASAGIVLPLLITGDLIAVKKYSKNAVWAFIWKLLPWTIGGLIIGLLVGSAINDAQFKAIIAGLVIVSLGIMLWMERRAEEKAIPNQWWFAAVTGLAGGFATMVGNAAGPVMMVYLLSMRLPKYEFIGTGAWFFAILNWLKVPLQVIFWGTITLKTLAFNLAMVPFIVLGAWLGIWAIKKIPEKPFRLTVMVLTAVTAIKLLF
jgi:uncharacterized protein